MSDSLVHFCLAKAAKLKRHHFTRMFVKVKGQYRVCIYTRLIIQLHATSLCLHFQSQTRQIEAGLQTQHDGAKLYQAQKRMNLTILFINL